MELNLKHIMPAFSLVLRLGMGMLFLWTGIPKMLAPQNFVPHVLDYGIAPPQIAGWVAILLPWLEITLGVCLIIFRKFIGAWLIAVLLCALFIYVNCSALSRGLSIECGCGLDSAQLSIWTFVRSCVLLGVCVLGYFAAFTGSRRKTAPEGALLAAAPTGAC